MCSLVYRKEQKRTRNGFAQLLIERQAGIVITRRVCIPCFLINTSRFKTNYYSLVFLFCAEETHTLKWFLIF